MLSSSGKGDSKQDQMQELPELSHHEHILAKIFDTQNAPDAGVLHISTAETVHDSVFDPFDGTLLGSIIPRDDGIQPEEPAKLNDMHAKNEELWSHLSRVLELQNRISRMHLEMEDIGAHANDPKGKGKTRSRAASIIRVVVDEGEGDDGIGGRRDEEAEMKKAREDQFSKLATQFRGKKQAIEDIMDKLDSLSQSVTEFHALQAPKIEFPSSRQQSYQTYSTAGPASAGLRSPDTAAPSSDLRPPVFPRHADDPPHYVESPLSATAALPP